MEKADRILKALYSSGKLSKPDLLLRLTKDDGDNYNAALAKEFGINKGYISTLLNEWEELKLVYSKDIRYANIKTYHVAPLGYQILKDLAKWDHI